jgi:ubiquinone/menaquinone biosynthesis C-methylase UbiE
MQSNYDSWGSGNQYEIFMGRWSNLIGQKFLTWLAIPFDRIWLDLGCGTGSLTKLILEKCQPKKVISIDSSSEFIFYSRQSIISPKVDFRIGMAQELKMKSNSVDAVVSGIMLNFVPQPEAAIAEMIRVAKPDGTIGIFVWDYSNGMEMLRYFWDTAVELDIKAREYDEGVRFPLCHEGELESLVKGFNLKKVSAVPLEETIRFKNFNDYWLPFLGRVGPAPSYVMNLREKDRQKLENRLREILPVDKDGSISLMIRAWAVKGSA